MIPPVRTSETDILFRHVRIALLAIDFKLDDDSYYS